ncbi:MAG: SET domain-containing protein [Bacteroidetes bacterium]|nr:SET domain-containing protein [Bacteroidota bacterium]
MRSSSLYIAPSMGKGRGVFTEESIPAETVIETAPVIVMESADRSLLDQTLLHDYIFEWGEDSKKCAMALGWVPLYNHALPANCEYFMDFEAEIIFIKTVRDIEPGEELFVNYQGDFDNDKPVWFQGE